MISMIGMRPMVTAKINGIEANFIADSGAFYSSLTPSAANDLKLPLRPTSTYLHVMGVGGEVKMSVTTVEEFTIFNIPLQRVQFLVGGSEPGAGAAGILGQNVLRIGGDVEYDLANGVIRILRSRDCDKMGMAYWAKAGKYSVIKVGWADVAHPHTMSTASINGHEIRVMFDTGAYTSMVSRKAVEKAGVEAELRRR